MQLISVISLLLIVGAAQAAVNGRCMVGSTPGVCISTNSCKHGGPVGTPHPEDFCRWDPDDIQCCTKTSCGKGGNCRWTDQCAGTSNPANLCPGPANFQCCEGPPRKCKPSVVKKAQNIQAKYKSDIQKLECEVYPSDANGFGLGYRFYVKPRANAINQNIAEWAVNNYSNLKINYVCWGYRYWDLKAERSAKPWKEWTSLGETGSDVSHCVNNIEVHFSD